MFYTQTHTHSYKNIIKYWSMYMPLKNVCRFQTYPSTMLRNQVSLYKARAVTQGSSCLYVMVFSTLTNFSVPVSYASYAWYLSEAMLLETSLSLQKELVQIIGKTIHKRRKMKLQPFCTLIRHAWRVGSWNPVDCI